MLEKNGERHSKLREEQTEEHESGQSIRNK